METVITSYLDKKFDELQKKDNDNKFAALRAKEFGRFQKAGIPGYKNEEWKYTFINNLFKKEYKLDTIDADRAALQKELTAMKLPGSENANELVFVDGHYAPELSSLLLDNGQLNISSLSAAANNEYKTLVEENLNQSSKYITDGLLALNSSFIEEGIFILVKKNQVIDKPIYIYHLNNAIENNLLAQPRSLLIVEESAKVQIVEHYHTIGQMDSLANEVMEIVVKENAIVEYYKIQQDSPNASQVGTTHIRQVGKSFVHTVTISLNGGIIRNNINIIMEEAGNEAHMYGLYLIKENTHVDNHTLVDNTKPNCFSNEFYKGIIDGHATGVFSGKIYVRPDAQKTNAYQSNKNILLSDTATVNTKPQLEIYADDVKCSHGCTVGQLDPEALFYLRTRGIGLQDAQAMLLQAFSSDILEQIKIEPLRKYVDTIVTGRLLPQEPAMAL